MSTPFFDHKFYSCHFKSISGGSPKHCHPKTVNFIIAVDIGDLQNSNSIPKRNFSYRLHSKLRTQKHLRSFSLPNFHCTVTRCAQVSSDYLMIVWAQWIKWDLRIREKFSTDTKIIESVHANLSERMSFSTFLHRISFIRMHNKCKI